MNRKKDLKGRKINWTPKGGKNMKYSTITHNTSIVFGIWGGLALVGAWLAGEGGIFFGFSQQHLYNDAVVLQLIAISAGICTLIRRQLEQK